MHADVKNLRLAAWDLQVKQRSLSKDKQGHRDASAKSKAQNRRLSGTKNFLNDIIFLYFYYIFTPYLVLIALWYCISIL